MEKFRSLFGPMKRLVVIGMVHVRALPGAPGNTLKMNDIVRKACEEAEIYKRNQLDAILVENMFDVPYLKGGVGPETVSAMTRVCSDVKGVVGHTPLGVQILAGANTEAVAVAQASGGQFVRAEGYVFSHVADEGWMDACSAHLTRYRRNIGAEDVLIFTDIKKKHSSHAITQDVSVTDTAEAAQFFMSDGVILTGTKTGDPAHSGELNEVKRTMSIPVIVGSGVTVDNLSDYKDADGVIVGSHFKREGVWFNDIEEDRVKRFMEAARII